MTEKRNWFNRLDVFLLLGLAVISVIILVCMNLQSADGVTAEIFSDGKLVESIKLDNTANGVYRISFNADANNARTASAASNVHYEIKNGQIRFIDVDCPDKLCENFGFLSREGELAVCLPNRVSIRISGKGNAVDAIVN